MITTNVLQRTFHVKYKNSTGTAFTIDYENKQYLISAKHVFPEIKATEKIEIFHENQWKNIEIQIVGIAPNDIDIIVLALPLQISPIHPLPATLGGVILGQDIYFLGFPFGLSCEVGKLNRDFPLPLVKKCCLSALLGHSKDDDPSVLFIDGINNPGFSGGPVVCSQRNKIQDYQVISVISGYRFQEQNTFYEGKPFPVTYKENTGIIISYGICHAIDLIRKNSIGCEIKNS
ncbi:MAG: serine protease [Candidatus Omnitrophota bacterium]